MNQSALAIPNPKRIHLNITENCNLTCRICRDGNNNITLTPEAIESVIEDTFDDLEELRLDSAGEAMTSKYFPRVLAAATEKNVPVFMSSNGILINESRAKMLVESSLSRIQISVDSPDKETLEFIRRGAVFEKVIEGTKNLIEARRQAGRAEENRLEIIFHAAILKQNLYQLPDLVRLAKDMGVDKVSCLYGWTHDIMDPDWSVYWMKEETNRVLRETHILAKELGVGFECPQPFNVTTKILQPPTSYCPYLFEWSYIHPSGKVYPCCIGSYELGNVYQERFSSIWNGHNYQELRRTYNTPEPAYDKCSSCYITLVWNPDDYRVHFAQSHWDYCAERVSKEPEVVYTDCTYGNYSFPAEYSDELLQVLKLRTNHDVEGAIKGIEVLLTKDSGSVELNLLLVDCLLEAKHLPRAEFILKQLEAIFVRPSDEVTSNQELMLAYKIEVLVKMAKLEMCKENPLKAVKIVGQIMEIAPNNKDALQMIATIRTQLDKRKTRLKVLQG